MGFTVEQIAEQALALPSEARALLADRLAASLDPSENDTMRRLWLVEAQTRRNQVRSGAVTTIAGQEALERVRKSVVR